MSKTVIMTVDQVQSVSAALENQVSEMQKVINEVASAHSSLAMDDILSLENYSLKLHWGLLKASSSLKKQSERLEQLGSAAKTAASGIETEDNGEGKVASSNGGKKSNNWVSWIGAAFPFTVPFTLAPFVAGLLNRNQGNNGSTSSDAYVLTEWNGKETVEKKSDEFHQYYEELEAEHRSWKIKQAYQYDWLQMNNPNVTEEFLIEVKNMSERLGVKPDDLMAVMAFESGGINPAAVNKWSGATGLIQFMPSTAEGLGTTTEALRGMSAMEQLPYVETYLSQHGIRAGRNNSLSDLYMAVLWPAAVGKPDGYVLFSSGSNAYSQNAGLDINHDGAITKAEAVQLVLNNRKGYVGA